MTRLSFHAALIAMLLGLTSPSLAIDADEMFDDPGEEARAREIGRDLRCLVCQNQSIFDSNASLARDLRVVVRERMEAGDSDGEVVEYIRARFGDYVLLDPPVTSQTTLLWLAPAFFLLLGGGLVALYLRGRRRESVTTPDPISEAEIAEARRLLSEEPN